MGGGIRIRNRYRSPSQSLKQKKPEFIKLHSKPIKILLVHDNRLDYFTDKAHRFAEWLDKYSEFEVIFDKQFWKRGEKTSKTETDKRERKMVDMADIIVWLIHPTSKAGEPLHEGSQREFRKAMRAGKPIIEIYYMGAKTSPSRSIQEKNYKYRIPIHLKRGERLEKGIRRGLEIYKQIKDNEL
ncbi:MAG: hypothetical protein ACTSVV_13860 [Promethearchaeota archaeon]